MIKRSHQMEPANSVFTKHEPNIQLDSDIVQYALFDREDSVKVGLEERLQKVSSWLVNCKFRDALWPRTSSLPLLGCADVVWPTMT